VYTDPSGLNWNLSTENPDECLYFAVNFPFICALFPSTVLSFSDVYVTPAGVVNLTCKTCLFE